MFFKVIFALDGLLEDIAGTDGSIGLAIVRRVAHDWVMDRLAFRSPILGRDWIRFQCSALPCFIPAAYP